VKKHGAQWPYISRGGLVRGTCDHIVHGEVRGGFTSIKEVKRNLVTDQERLAGEKANKLEQEKITGGRGREKKREFSQKKEISQKKGVVTQRSAESPRKKR